MKNKFFTLFLTLMASVGTTFAETLNGTCGENLNWSLNTETGVLIISGSGYMDDYYVPETSSDTTPWYDYRSSITSIVFPDGLLSIGSYAFYDCNSFTSIEIPNTVKSIGYAAFEKCSSLTAIEIPNSVTTIANYALMDCSSLETVTIGSGVKTLGSGVFTNCPVIKSISVASSNTNYDSRDNCNAIIETATNILLWGCVNTTIPNTIEGVKFQAFQECNCANCTEYEGNIHYFKTCLLDIPSPNKKLSSFTIREGTTGINWSAFQGCENLTSIDIPNTVEWIGSDAFGQCNSLMAINVANDNTKYCSTEGVLFNKKKTTLLRYPVAKQEISYIVSQSVTSIDYYAFSECVNLTSIELPQALDRIEEATFYGCENLSSIEIPSTVTEIEPEAFELCSSITSITIPQNVTDIGFYAFAGCSGLTSITCLSETPPTLGKYTMEGTSEVLRVFDGVDKSIPIYVPAKSIAAYKKAEQWKDFTNIQAIPGTEPSVEAITVAQAIAIGQALGNGGYTAEEYEITGYVIGVREAYDQDHKTHSVWVIDALDNANSGEALHLFRGSVEKELKIGNKISVKAKIGNYKGDIETSRGNVTILDDTERIPSIVSGVCGAVGDRTNLTWLLNTSTGYLEIKGSGAMINFSTYHFSWRTSPYISSVRKVILPTELTSIGTAAFAGCVNLDSIVIPEKVDSIWAGAFNSCVSLTHINIPESVKAIGYEAFSGCTGLTEPLHNSRLFVYMPKSYEGKYIVPDGITAVISMSFAQCANITEIVMPASVKRLGYSVFEGCSTLQSLTCYAVNPPECRIDEAICENNTFCGVDITIPLYVPAESIDAYKDSLGWKDFTNIQAIQPAVPTEGTCGENLRWAYDKTSNILTISGSGAMYDFETGADVPWASYVTTMTGIALPKGLTTFGKNAFRDCNYVRAIRIPTTLTASGDDAFYGCFVQIVRVDDFSAWCKVKFGNEYSNPLYYGQLYTKDEETPTTHLHIPADVTDLSAIGGLDIEAVEVEDIASFCTMSVPETFHPREIYIGGKLVEHLIIPEGVTFIRERAFEEATCLLSVTFPTTLKAIGYFAFQNCNNINTMTVNAIEPPITDSLTFSGVKRDVKMNVPCESVEAYMTAVRWSEFTNYQSAVDMPIDSVTIYNDESYDWHGLHLDTAGVYRDTVFYTVSGCDSIRYTLVLSLTSRPTKTYVVTVTSDNDEAGVVKGGGTYQSGEKVTLTATANEGYVFAKWSDGETANPYEFNASEDIELVAYFYKKQAEEPETEVVEPQAEPTDNSVVIAWPVIEGAEVYTIEIRKGDELICTLEFNEQGQLISITFAAPARNGSRKQPQMATQTANGWQYTINGLDPNTEYTYTVTAKKEDDSVLYEKTVEFTTEISQGLDQVNDQQPTTSKILRDGQLIILRGDRTYTLTGQEVR